MEWTQRCRRPAACASGMTGACMFACRAADSHPFCRRCSWPQVALFYNTGVCLPWISLLFGAVVLALVQLQKVGGHPALFRVVQPALGAVAVAATLLKLLLMQRHARAAPRTPSTAEDPTADLFYMSGALRALLPCKLPLLRASPVLMATDQLRRSHAIVPCSLQTM